jgi:hypothetical protein
MMFRSIYKFLQDNIKLITSTGDSDDTHNDLIPHILLQLQTTTIPLFQQAVLQWQRNYFEGTLSLTPSSLLTKADRECQVLRHAGQWVETIDPSVTALQAMILTTKQQSGDVFNHLAANFSQITQRQKEITCSIRSASPSTVKGHQSPDWMRVPPQYPDQIRHFNGRYWHFCTKYGTSGKWVCTHNDATHGDSSRNTHSSSSMSRRSSQLDSLDTYGWRSRFSSRDYDR